MIIAVSSWSFHDALYKGTLRLLEVPFRVYDLGYRAVELQDMFLWPKPPNRLLRLLGRKPPALKPREYDRKALRGVRLNRFRSGTQLVGWAIESDLTVEDAAREEQLAYLGAAIQTARYLNASLIRFTLGGEVGDRSAVDRAVSLMSGILPVTIAAGVKLAVENHGGLSRDPDTLIEFVQACRGRQASVLTASHLGVCLDIGNFERDPQTAMAKLAPYAIHVHAKSRAFDAAGEEISIDYKAALAALRAVGYDGPISIEFEGDGDPAAGIHKTRDLIEKYW